MAPRSLTLPVPESNWIPREMHRHIARMLIDHKLSKIDNTRQLPLANGGKTDLYVDVRPGRSNPQANMVLATLYAQPLRWLGISRFLEVPDAISSVASLVSSITGIPYATIRKQPKEGRASDAQIIGEVYEGEEVVIIDDVITDGESKLPALRLCEKRGLKVRAIIVLVDRQQGWQTHLHKNGINMPVWAGMTLHDFRREAIAMGAMQRCDPDIEARNPIIVALDGKSLSDTLSLADRLRPTGCILKVNDLLFAKGIDNLLPELMPYGRVMADLKSNDIPGTVLNVMHRLRKHEPWAVTVHASGGYEMVSEARSHLRDTKVLAVTVLTSMLAECKKIFGREPLLQVEELAKIVGAGVDGFVCSSQEVSALRALFPKALLVVPGVRSPGAETHDQKRVDTPANVMAAGADHIVMGRQILNAKDPVAEVLRVLGQELNIR